mmetsp:Transcript_11263/g.11298  ORF Transcript_11263/g.11298 Transcript_11263/m.11298 type:complete len:377 (-) Transcript_11263:66-1196(-)
MISSIIKFAIVGLPIALSFRLPARNCFQKNNILSSTAQTSVNLDTITDQIIGKLNANVEEGKADAKYAKMFADFFEEYKESCKKANEDPKTYQFNVMTFISTIQQASVDPYKFKPFHEFIREPFDYYKWGNEFLKPLMILEQSRIVGLENAKKIEELLTKGDNVMILSNHQTEADPQVLSNLLQRENMASLAEKMIFIAGHKVTTDPVAIPFSMGRNLLCIHSKKHIRNPPEEFTKKQADNLASMKALGDLASEGGRLFWVAPSGGRDRPDESGEFQVAPLDAKSLDMFRIIAMQSKKPLHFFPMAMYTNRLVPPPKDLSSDVGEARSAARGPVSAHFLPETDGLGGLKDKQFAHDLQCTIETAYADLVKWHKEHE